MTSVSTTPLVAEITEISAAGGPVAPAPRPRGSLRRRDKIVGTLAVIPAFVVVVGFMVYPVLFALYISFNRSNGVSFEWVGFENYIRLLVDPLVHQVFLNNLKFLISVPLVIFVSIIISVLLFERVRGWKFFRIVYFLPNVLSAVVIGIMFKQIFGYYGMVNEVLAAFGAERIQFFTNGNLAIAVIIVALIWSGFGYQSLLLLSGLTAIDPAVFEAASLDGAGWWKRVWYITLPNIRRVLGFVFIINVLYTFTSLFGFIYVMTAGGPGYDTTTVDYLVFLKAFETGNKGPGAALAVMLFVFIGLLTVLQNRVFRISEED